MKKVILKEKRAFTVIEILLIVFIIGLLAAIVLVRSVSGKNKAAINSYKTTMNSVKTAMELCGEGNINTGLHDGNGTIKVCVNGHDEVFYPKMEAGCGVEVFEFSSADPGLNNWAVSTTQECKGCRIICSVDGCGPWTGYEDACK